MDVGVFKPFLSGISRDDPTNDTSLLKGNLKVEN